MIAADHKASTPSRPIDSDFPDEEPTVVTPRITTRELIALDPDGHYARANCNSLTAKGVA